MVVIPPGSHTQPDRAVQWLTVAKAVVGMAVFPPGVRRRLLILAADGIAAATARKAGLQPAGVSPGAEALEEQGVEGQNPAGLACPHLLILLSSECLVCPGLFGVEYTRVEVHARCI